MARLVWTDRGVRYYDPEPRDASIVEVSFGRAKAAAKLEVQRVERRGNERFVVSETIVIEKPSRSPAQARVVSRREMGIDQEGR